MIHHSMRTDNRSITNTRTVYRHDFTRHHVLDGREDGDGLYQMGYLHTMIGLYDPAMQVARVICFTTMRESIFYASDPFSADDEFDAVGWCVAHGHEAMRVIGGYRFPAQATAEINRLLRLADEECEAAE